MAEIASGSLTLFKQTTPPAGWTKITTYNDYTLRVVSGSVSSGGDTNFSTLFTSVTPSGTISGTGPSSTGATTLSTSQLPSHTHSLYNINSNPTIVLRIRQPEPSGPQIQSRQPAVTIQTGSAGGGAAHSHTFSLSVTAPGFTGDTLSIAIKYVDIILAERD